MISMVLLTACVREDINVTTSPAPESFNIEIFTRAQKMQLPETRGWADQSGVDMTPFVLVFDESETCIEVVKAFEISGINKRYVTLTHRSTGKYRFLILANNEKSGFGGQQFWLNGDHHPWTIDEVKGACLGEKLTDISQNVLTEKLNIPQRDFPFAGSGAYLLPMTYLTDPVEGIDENTKIGEPEGVGNGPLELIRSVAKIIITNDPYRDANKIPYNNFKMTGIMSIGNTPIQGKVYNSDGTYLTSVGLTEIAHENYASSICEVRVGEDPYVQSHWGDLIFINETAAERNTYFIIEGELTNADGVNTYYYKMHAVDWEQKSMDLKRNFEYNFTIRNVRGPGYKTPQEAIASPSANQTIFWYDVTTVDLSSHHIKTNGQYYLGVSNSRYIAHTDNPTDLSAFSIVTDYPFSTGLASIRNEIITSQNISCNVSRISSSTNATNPLVAKISFLNGATSGSVDIWLGNLKLTVNVEREPIISSAEKWLAYYQYFQDTGSPVNKKWEYQYYLVSGTVDSGAVSWIKLAPGSNNYPETLVGPGPYYDPDHATVTNVTDNVASSHGKIQVRIDSNGGVARNGTFYLSTGYNPDDVTGQKSVERIKFDIKQAAFPN